MAAPADAGSLQLLGEAKIARLLGAPDTERFEASGVVAVGSVCYIIFDNTTRIGRISTELEPAAPDNVLIDAGRGRDVGYEDIAHDPATGDFFLLVEARRRGNRFMAKVREYDSTFQHVSSGWLDLPLETPNKGIEGLTLVSREGERFLLASCEGNRCKGGAAGRRTGGGRVHVFAREGRDWARAATIRLPKSLPFEDYSSLAVDGERVAVVSQASSALWLGTLTASGWDVVDEGAVFGFPRDAQGKTVYATPEGVAWLGADRLAVVSDKAKPTQPARCRKKDQSLHLFAVPSTQQAAEPVYPSEEQAAPMRGRRHSSATSGGR